MSAFERWLLNLSSGVATLTGLVYLYMKEVMRSDDPFSILHHPWQPHVLALHVLSGPVVVFALGLIARDHILGRLQDARPHRSRRAGITIMVLAAPMIASAYLLQVVSQPAPRRALVWIHVGSGVLFALLFIVHVAAARTRRGASDPKSDRPPGRRRAAALPCLDWLSRRGIESKTSSGGRIR